MNIDILPNDIIREILLYTNPRNINNFLISKRINKIYDSFLLNIKGFASIYDYFDYIKFKYQIENKYNEIDEKYYLESSNYDINKIDEYFINLYNIENIVKENYNLNAIFNISCSTGLIKFVKYIYNNFKDYIIENNNLFYYSIIVPLLNRYHDIVKFLINFDKINITKNSYNIISCLIDNGDSIDTEIFKFLIEDERIKLNNKDIYNLLYKIKYPYSDFVEILLNNKKFKFEFDEYDFKKLIIKLIKYDNYYIIKILIDYNHKHNYINDDFIKLFKVT